MKNTELIKRLSYALRQSPRVVFAYLFGSILEYNLTSISDIDIAVYTKKKLNFSDKLEFIHQIGKNAKTENIDITFLNDLRNLELIDTIIGKGKLLVDKDTEKRESFELKVQHMAIDFKFQRKVFMGI